MGTRARVKFSHTGGVKGRRERVLARLQTIKEPNKRQLAEMEILERRIAGKREGY